MEKLFTKLISLNNKQIVLIDTEIKRLKNFNSKIKYRNTDIVNQIKQKSYYEKYNIIYKNNDMIETLENLKYNIKKTLINI